LDVPEPSGDDNSVRRIAILFSVAAGLLFAPPALANSQQLTYRYGPVSLGPHEVEQNTALGGVPKPSVDGFITRMEVDVVDGSGQKVSPTRVMLHHIVFLNLGEAGKFDHRDWTCTTFTGLDSKTKVPALADRFYASGEERNILELPDGYGYRVSGKDNWILLWMLMNHRHVRDRVFIEYKVTYETERQLAPAYMVWLDVRNCLSDPVFDVPGGGAPGSVFSQSTTWTAPTSGRLVAGGGHVHGGGKNVVLSQPDCGDRELFTSRPLYGMPDSPVYRVTPVLHEPGPESMSGFLSPQGLPLARGQRLKLTANYDNRYPHTRVMGIMGVYFSPDGGVSDGCGPLPPIQTYSSGRPGRSEPPRFKVPLARKPLGRLRRLGRSATVRVRDFSFNRERIRVPRGATVRWRFEGANLHNITVATGPRGFSSPNMGSGRTFRARLKTPGTYRLFCTVHPTDMVQEIRVSKRR
jgi:hypothetical protein